MRILVQLNNLTHSHVRSLEHLPHDLGEYSAIVLYLHHRKLSGEALAKLDDFVSAGGGLLGVHSATASYKQIDRYFEIIGGRLIGHGPVEKFTVQPTGHTEIFPEIFDFDVKDELYIHETQPGIEVHFTAKYEGDDIPVVWTHTHGRGKVCYAEPGHRVATFNVTAYQSVLQQGLLWVAGA
jgi:type 1 glutamine amidotransferase